MSNALARSSAGADPSDFGAGADSQRLWLKFRAGGGHPLQKQGASELEFSWRYAGGDSAEDDKIERPRILAILRQAESCVPIAVLCREHGMRKASVYDWLAKHGRMDASMIAQRKALEEVSWRLRVMFTELSRQTELPKEAF